VEKQIAKALALELAEKPEKNAEFRFHDNESVFVITYVRQPIEATSDIGAFLSVGSGGQRCPCCNGSGKKGPTK